LEATNRRVDPVGEAMDVVLRVRRPPLEDSDLVMRVLARRSQCLVASPELVGALGLPKAPADMSEWPSMGLGPPQENHVWNLSGPQGEQVELYHTPRFVTGDMASLQNAALAGIGAVQLPIMFIREQLAAGTLVSLLPGWAPKADIVHAVFPSRRGLLPSVRALVDYLAARYQVLGDD